MRVLHGSGSDRGVDDQGRQACISMQLQQRRRRGRGIGATFGGRGRGRGGLCHAVLHFYYTAGERYNWRCIFYGVLCTLLFMSVLVNLGVLKPPVRLSRKKKDI